MSANSDNQRHMPQLDSLRALAVLGVMVEHFVHTSDIVRTSLPWGAFGVRLFFVLSGFLISGILLRCRSQVERGELTLRSALWTFFARRFIRLMPIYYVYLGAIALMLPLAREYLLIFMLYLQNFLFALNPHVFEVLLAHFWTLAVEEQFYLTWPAILLLVPLNRLGTVLVTIVALGPLLRLVGLCLGMSPHQISMMMPAHFDTLGLGGLLAFWQQSSASDDSKSARYLVKLGFRLGLPLSVVAVASANLGFNNVSLIMSEGAMGLLCAWIVASAAHGFGGFGGRVLNSPALQYLGKISYGIYVYHFNVPGLLREKIAPNLWQALPDLPWLRFPFLVLTTIMIASVSWHFFELPLNKLKRRFEYRVVLPQPTL